jgi:putative sugar O-methyltransferase
LNRAYAPLNGEDIDAFHSFLANFGASKEYTGIEHSTLIRECMSDSTKRIRLESYAVARLIADWTDRESKGRPLSALHCPLFGNILGVTVADQTLTLNACAYDAGSSLVTTCLPAGPRVIAELGGGYGGWVPFLARKVNELTYLDFDLPETLCCAAYYLMKAFPEKRFLLYGEREFCPECLVEFDVILLPSFEITALPDRSVDLFLNCASLSEMKPATALRFLQEIWRTTDAFWHMNHEDLRNEFTDGSSSLLNGEYRAPDGFVLMSRHFFTWSVLYYLFPEGWDYYWYLYRRR